VNVNKVPSNLASQRTAGLDLETSYRHDLSDIVSSWAGSLSIRALATHVLELKTITPSGLVVNGNGVLSGILGEIDQKALAAPKWRYNVTFGYDLNHFSASWTGRGFSAGVQSSLYTQCTANCPTLAAPYYSVNNNHMPGAFYQDLSFTYHVNPRSSSTSKLEFAVIVENLANWEPNGVAQIYYEPGFYDTLGRVFRASVNYKM
jgi:iron complex outermembrane receptor protein